MATFCLRQSLVEPVILCLTSLLLVILLPLPGAAEHLENYRYRQQTGDEIQYFDWLLEKSEGFKLSSVSKTEIHRTFMDGNLCTDKWTMENPAEKTAVEARRQADRIILTGHWRGQSLRKELRIDHAPWYQALSLSLRAFLASPENRAEFWTLRPDELKPLKLKAAKKGLETLRIDGRSMQAQKLEIRLIGLGALFGHSLYWFRSSDGLFLKYQGPNGIPGLATTTVTLEKEMDSTPEVQSGLVRNGSKTTQAFPLPAP